MSKRLQVLMPDDEFEALRALAADRGVGISEFVRATMRQAARTRSTSAPDARIAAIRRASVHQFPAPDIDQMLREIEAGYGTTLA
jgi:Ribbon-helix-helix protein, copG family